MAQLFNLPRYQPVLQTYFRQHGYPNQLLRQPDLEDVGTQLEVDPLWRLDGHHGLSLSQLHWRVLQVGRNVHVPGNVKLPYGDSLPRQRLSRLLQGGGAVAKHPSEGRLGNLVLLLEGTGHSHHYHFVRLGSLVVGSQA